MEANAFLADSVVVADNKLFAQGAGWDSVVSPVFPFIHPRVGIGVIFQVPWALTNRMHQFSVHIVDPDGKRMTLADAPGDNRLFDEKVRELRGHVNVGQPPLLAPGDTQVVPIALNLDRLTFSKAGEYRVVVSVDGSELRRIPFYVRATGPLGVTPAGPRYV